MRRAFSMLLCLLTLLLCTPLALASDCNIQDNADLLSGSERSSLEESATQIADEYDIAVVILTVDSLNDASTWDYADEHFYHGGYGDDGILLLISMEYRDWEIATYGAVASMISDGESDRLFDVMADDLRSDNFYLGFSAYLDALDRTLSSAGIPYSRNKGLQFFVSLAIGAVVALITLLVMRGKMNTARPQRSATNYMKQDSYKLTARRDVYLYSNTTRIRRAQNSSSGGGGGRSRGGSRGKF